MAIKPIILIFIYGQLWWNHTSGKTKGPASVLPSTALVLVGLDSEPHSSSYQASKSKDPTKNEQQISSHKPQLPITTEEPKGAEVADEHLIVAVVIGVILLLMILIIIAIFLWRKRKRANSPLPHWAGRSPFADGDMPDHTVDKEPVQGIKRMSVLSLLPWKFNKDAQLLENTEGQLSESRQNVNAPQGCSAAGTESESSYTATAILDSSTSTQTQLSEEPNNLTDISLQPESPRLLDPPSSSWPHGVNVDICTHEPCPLEQNVEIQCSIPPDLSQQNVGEAGLLPPPPEDFLCN
ncbi:protein EVI2B [Candoia aspera]|uniref:protein EVI2B n=1 Tax=Candoia aspera TaxID=51853 RepID=UPI002FD833B2